MKEYLRAYTNLDRIAMHGLSQQPDHPEGLFDPLSYEIYTDPSDAVQELLRRRADPLLQRSVEDFVGHLPDTFPQFPFTAMIRQVARAKYEDLDFILLRAKTPTR